MATGFCKNHPEVSAQRRCFTCSQFICPECRFRRRHHYFCSERCHRRFLLHESFRSFFKPIVETLQPLWHWMLPWLIEKAGLRKPRGLSRAVKYYDLLISMVAILLLASPLIGIALLWRENHQLQNRLVRLEQAWKNAAIADSHAAGNGVANGNHVALKITRPAASRVLDKQIAVAGEVPDGYIISLTQNNRVCAVTLSRAGQFTLPAIKLNSGPNEFVVQAFGHDGKIVAQQNLAFTSGPPPAAYLTRDLSRGNVSHQQVALTFDGGSTDNATQPILDILKENNLQVTIFLTGSYIQKFPEMTRRMAQEGHEVGNHTWNHPHLTTYAADKSNASLPNVTREFLHDQLLRTANLFAEVTGVKMAPFWRAPYGEHNTEIRQWAAELGYRHVGWTKGRSWQESLDTMDWVADTTSNAYHPSEEILAHLLNLADEETPGLNGGIILTHLGSHRQDGDHFYTVLPRLISGLREKNYALVKISELAE
jgi:peptidoglycan/xylan/chitin deacetylase (PgdA/CDA1 family)